MADPEDVLADSPADFDSSFAYALHSEMRRLLIAAVVGWMMFSVGLGMFFGAGIHAGLLDRIVGLAVGLVGATLFFGGVVGTAFKVVTDANIVAAERRVETARE